MEYSKRIFEIILQCGLEGLRIEDLQIDQDTCKIFFSVPATSAIGTLAGEDLAIKFKELYIEEFKEEVEKDLIDKDWSQFISMYYKIRDEEWTEEKCNGAMDLLNQFKQFSSDYQVI